MKINMKVKRYKYDADCGLVEDKCGQYVKYDDYMEMSNYADSLVQFGKLPCLPKDLENLRNANADLAMEVHRLQETLRMVRAKINNDKVAGLLRHTGNAFQYTPEMTIQFGMDDKVSPYS